MIKFVVTKFRAIFGVSGKKQNFPTLLTFNFCVNFVDNADKRPFFVSELQGSSMHHGIYTQVQYLVI